MGSPGGGEKVLESPFPTSFSHWGGFWSPGSPGVAPRRVPGPIFPCFRLELGSPGVLFPTCWVRFSEEEIQKNASTPSCLSACWGVVSASRLRTGNHKRGGGVGRSPLDMYIYIYIYCNSFLVSARWDHFFKKCWEPNVLTQV